MSRSIDHLLKSPRMTMHISDSEKPQTWCNDATTGTTVYLDVKDGDGIVVKISAIDKDKQLCQGEVIHGSWSADETKRIEEGENVEFSRDKISCIVNKT